MSQKKFRASNYSLSIVVLSNLPDLSKTLTQSNLIANGLLNRNNQPVKKVNIAQSVRASLREFEILSGQNFLKPLRLFDTGHYFVKPLY